jgi:hypothetical protein
MGARLLNSNKLSSPFGSIGVAGVTVFSYVGWRMLWRTWFILGGSVDSIAELVFVG